MSRGLSEIGWRGTRVLGRSRGLDWMARLKGARKRTVNRVLYIILTEFERLKSRYSNENATRCFHEFWQSTESALGELDEYLTITAT